MSATTEFSETPFQSFKLLVSGDIWGENPARAQRFSIGNLKDEASGQAFRRQPSHHRSAACHRPFAAMGRNAGAHSGTISKHPTVRVLPLNKGGPQRQGRPPGWPSHKPRSKAHQNPGLPVAREHLTSRPHLPAAPVTNASCARNTASLTSRSGGRAPRLSSAGARAPALGTRGISPSCSGWARVRVFPFAVGAPALLCMGGRR